MSPATHPPLTFAFECTHSLLPHGCSPYVLCFLARTPPPSPFTWRGCVYMKLLVFARAPPCLDRPLFLFFLFFLFLLFPPFLPLSQQPFVVHPILFSLFSFLFPLSSFLYSSPFPPLPILCSFESRLVHVRFCVLYSPLFVCKRTRAFEVHVCVCFWASERVLCARL